MVWLRNSDRVVIFVSAVTSGFVGPTPFEPYQYSVTTHNSGGHSGLIVPSMHEGPSCVDILVVIASGHSDCKSDMGPRPLMQEKGKSQVVDMGRPATNPYPLF